MSIRDESWSRLSRGVAILKYDISIRDHFAPPAPALQLYYLPPVLLEYYIALRIWGKAEVGRQLA